MKKNELKSMLKDIDKYSKIIKESYIFDEDEDLVDNDDMDYDDNDDMSDDIESSKSAEDRINDIRSIALEGIQDFAEEVDSDEYNIFKNIWMTCDKFYLSKNKEEEDDK